MGLTPHARRRMARELCAARLSSEFALLRAACRGGRRLLRSPDLFRLIAAMPTTSDEEAGAVPPMKYLAHRTRLLPPDAPRPPPHASPTLLESRRTSSRPHPTRRSPLAGAQETIHDPRGRDGSLFRGGTTP